MKKTCILHSPPILKHIFGSSIILEHNNKSMFLKKPSILVFHSQDSVTQICAPRKSGMLERNKQDYLPCFLVSIDFPWLCKHSQMGYLGDGAVGLVTSSVCSSNCQEQSSE